MRSVLGNTQRPKVTFDRTGQPQVAHAPHFDANLHPRRLEHDLLSPPPKPAGAKPTDSQSLLQQISHTINRRESSTAPSSQHGESQKGSRVGFQGGEKGSRVGFQGGEDAAIHDCLSAAQDSLTPKPSLAGPCFQAIAWHRFPCFPTAIASVLRSLDVLN